MKEFFISSDSFCDEWKKFYKFHDSNWDKIHSALVGYGAKTVKKDRGFNLVFNYEEDAAAFALTWLSDG